MSRPTTDELIAADREARRLACSVFDRPVVLEAGAGTGKTATLVARVLCFCLERGWRQAQLRSPGAGDDEIAEQILDRILAITFTEKATVEMAERISDGFGRLRRGEAVIGVDAAALGVDLQTMRRRAVAFESRQDRLRVATIHGFCRRLLAANAIEAGLRPGFDVDADGRATDEIVERVIGEFVTRAFNEPCDEVAVALLADGLGPGALREIMGGLLARGLDAAALVADPFPRDRVRSLAARLSSDLAALAATCAAMTQSGHSRAKGAIAGMIEAGDLGRRLENIECIEVLVEAATDEGATESLSKTLKKWSGGKLTETEAGLLGDAALEAVELARRVKTKLDAVRRVDAARLRRLFAVLRPLLGEAKGAMIRAGIVRHDDLLIGAARLLKSNSEIRGRVRASLDLLLVDEVQDTDPVQFDIVTLLALEDDGGNARPSLFVVGDAKQSIYGFRSADVGAFQRFVHRVKGEFGGVVRPLYCNYRSVPAILAEVERLIDPIMPFVADRQSRFEPLVAAGDLANDPGFRKVGRRPVEHWCSWVRTPTPNFKPGVEKACAIEARAIAEDIATLRADDPNLRLSGIAILLQKLTRQESYLAELRNHDIPYVVDGDRSFFRRREIVDATAATAVVLDPFDTLSSLTWLRSPLVGAPDAAIIPLWRHGFPDLMRRLGMDARAEEEFATAVRAAANDGGDLAADPQGWVVSLIDGARSVAYLRRLFGRSAADDFVDRLRRLIGCDAAEASRWLGAHRLDNLERYFRLLLDALTRGEGSPALVLAELRRAVRDAESDPEGPASDDSVDAVRVMTIHKAKGLTFDQVYLPGLNSGTRMRGDDLALLPGDGGFEMSLMGVTTLGFGDAEAARREREAAERVRLLYVAATRPRHRLVIAGAWVQDAREWRRARHLADLVAARRPALPDPATRLPDADPAREAFELATDDENLRCLLVHTTAFEEPTNPRQRAETPFDWPHLERFAQELDGDRERAQARSATKPWRAPSDDHGVKTGRYDDSEDDLRSTPTEVRFDLDAHARRLVGTAVHRALEQMHEDAAGDVDAAVGVATTILRRGLGRGADAAVAQASTLLRGFAAGTLGRRFAEIAAGTRRELPILLLERQGDQTVTWTGAIDLLYREPDTNDFVIVDFKTDAVSDRVGAERRAQDYAEQCRVYTRAVQVALSLPRRPRAELWFLSADCIVEVTAD